jgi:hypothetical protein
MMRGTAERALWSGGVAKPGRPVGTDPAEQTARNTAQTLEHPAGGTPTTDDRRLHQLRNALDRSRERARWARDELWRFDRRDTGESNLSAARDRLVEDVRRAELDAAWCEVALADATAPTEVPA